MNTRIFCCLLCVPVLASGAVAAYGPPVSETGHEFFVYGDFKGDGSRSYLVVDRASGGMRQANTLSGGGLIMAPIRVAGVTDITGAAVGRFTLTDRDTIAVTSPTANRVRVCGPSGAHFDGWPSGVGPRHVTGVELPGGSAGRSDLVATTVINRPGTFGPYQQSFMLNNTLQFSNLTARYPAALPTSPLAVRFADAQPAYYAELRPNGGLRDFVVLDSTDAEFPVLTSCSGVNPGSRVVYGNLITTDPTSEIVFHAPGSNTIQVSSVGPGGLLTEPVAHTLPERADLLQVVEGGGGLWLAAVIEGGADLHLYVFGLSTTPQLAQVIAPPAGRTWSGVVPAAAGQWFAASTPDGETSSSFRRFEYVGTKTHFRASGDYDLEPLFPEELGCDVLLFDGQPFIDNNPILRGRYRAGGWTSNLNDDPSFPSTMDANFEVWRSADLGLGDPVYQYLGIRPTGVTHGLSNQITPDSSFYSLDSPIGGVPDLVSFAPEAGPQTAGIEVTLTTDDPATSIYYSIGTSTRWDPYSGPLGPFSSDTTIRAYASNGGTKSPIQSASYSFPSYPGDVDSDGDSLPDFVEEAHGLDPLGSGLDSDLDGVSDLTEILAGTDPTDGADTPDQATIRSYTRHFDIVVEPLSHSGVPHSDPLTPVPSIDPGSGKIRSDIGTWVTVNRPDGTLELEKTARGGILGAPPVKLTDLDRTVENPPLFWVVGTPSRFHIDLTGEPDRLRGRGVFRLLDYDAPDLYPLPRPELSGNSAQQAAQWVAAMRDHFSANAEILVGGRLSLFETVDLLLAEHALGTIFKARGLIPDHKLTLTPFRGDVANGRHPLDGQWLAELPDSSGVDNGYDWGALLDFIRAANLPQGTPRNPLDELAREVYRIGFHAYDDPANPLNVTPFDALREFMDTGTLPAAYAGLLTVPATVVDEAVSYRTAFGVSLPQRSYTPAPLTLIADPGFFQDPWIVLRREASGTSYRLADALGQPLGQPSGFRILPGCRFLVTGHTSALPEGGYLLMADSITLIDAALPDPTDSDRNTLADNWEGFYFGILGNDAFDDPDGDGYMTLQEMFETKDPLYGPDYPLIAAIDLGMPRLYFDYLGSHQFDLYWRWPTTYLDRVRFYVEASSDLRNYDIIADDIPANGDLFEVIVDGSGHPRHFFRIGLGLR